MTITKSKIGIMAIGIVAMVAFVASIAHANPLYFLPTTQSATATTSATYLVSGAATTTIIASYDSWATAGQPQVTDAASLFIQMAASSTSSVLDTTFEYSGDGIDWYQDNQQLVTSTGNITISTPNNYVWTAIQTATSSKMITMPTPTRFVRVKTSVSGAGAAVWMQIVPRRQRN